MKLKQEDKAICVQACINGYYGSDGKVDWTNFNRGSIDPWDVKNQEGYTCEYSHLDYGKILIVMFQGTRSNQDKGIDWKYNFDTKLIKKIVEEDKDLVVPYGNEQSKIKMHNGFVELYSYIRTHVREKIKNAIKNNQLIWITGHSLGGAEATVCYIDIHYMLTDELKMKKEDVDRILTGYAAASPRVGNKEFVESFNKRADGNFYNEFYGEDTIHQVPRWWQGYPDHVKEEKRYADLITNIQTPFVNIFKFITLGFLPSVAIHDHFPQKLLAAVKGEKIPTWLDCAKHKC